MSDLLPRIFFAFLDKMTKIGIFHRWRTGKYLVVNTIYNFVKAVILS